jgi:tRNA(fMet)-specific endonuclease VapC
MTRRRSSPKAQATASPDHLLPMPPIVLDTNVVSYLFNRDTRAAPYLPHLAGRLLVISFMTMAELDAWAEVSHWGQGRRERLERFLASYVTHYPDRELCRLWAGVFAEARTKGKPIQTADAWIAATALLYGVPLLTHDAGDYAGVDELQIITQAHP